MALILSGDTGVPASGMPAGSVIQTVSVVFTNAIASSTTTFADTGMSATITPISASNKILVLVNHGGVSKNVGNANNAVKIQLLRDSSVIFAFANLLGFTNSSLYNVGFTASTSYLDSPATTSAVTYKTQFANYTSASSIEINANSDKSTLTLLEIKV